MKVKKFNTYLNESVENSLQSIGDIIFKEIYDNEISKTYDTKYWNIDYEYDDYPGASEILGLSITVFFEYGEIALSYLDELEKYNELKKLSQVHIGFQVDTDEPELYLSLFFDFDDIKGLDIIFDKYPSIITYAMDAKIPISDNIKNNPKFEHIFNMKDIGLF
ncbi:hypothetical protein M0Q50_08235 [bacterium]|jgi:hypothetical protein|nr:hypothetical protein [bacterium]